VTKLLSLDFNNAMSSRVGAHGLADRELAELRPSISKAVQAIQADRKRADPADWLEWMDLPVAMPPIARLIAANSRRRSYTVNDLVVCGIGGSALGPTAVQTSLRHSLWNLLAPDARGQKPRLHVMDNIDPTVMRQVADWVDPATALFVVITKSGTTAETLSQLLIAADRLNKKVGAKMNEHFIFVTDAKKGLLRAAGQKMDVETYDIGPGVGGRFSVLSPVGLVSAVYTGVDAEAMLAGAAEMDQLCREPDMSKNPAAAYAAVMYLLDTLRRKPMHVLMPYSSGLRDVADWFRQLWAESLGKRVNRSGAEVFTGPTPIKSLGATDQHSQVQLYVEGPNDKVITIMALGRHESPMPIPKPAGALASVPGISEGDYLSGRDMGELLEAERVGTTVALTEAKRPNLTITLPRLDARSVGAAFYFFEFATAVYGRLLDIDAFNQPGVEAGKLAAFALMGRKGFEKRRAELEAAPKPEAKYIVG
jgi:glucose-6-phosphate isomerase